MNSFIVIARKEWKDIVRDGTFRYLVAGLAVLTFASLVVSFLVLGSQVREYNESLSLLKELGKSPATPFPELHPLNLLKGVVEYIEIIGGVLGILLGYISISKERGGESLNLVLTRPLRKINVILGKMAGNAIFIAFLMALIGFVVFFTVWFVGGVRLNTGELTKLLVFVMFSTLYVFIFFMMSFIFALTQKSSSHALIYSFIAWLAFVLIIPQIGDTMDPDNQVPGGFFKSMNLNKKQERNVLKHIRSYEIKREFIEQLSVAKHFERVSFALLGVNVSFNNQKISKILTGTSIDIFWMAVFFFVVFIGNIHLMLQEGD